jgi:elongation factor G
MTPVAVGKKRNISLVGHGGSGKTSLTEALVFSQGVVTRLGKIEEGNTLSDNTPEEIRKKHSIYSSVVPFIYRDHQITLMDTPGYLDFIGEMVAALSVSDGAVIVVNAQAGIESQTIRGWDQAGDLKLARMFAINHMDKENAKFGEVVDSLKEEFGGAAAVLAIPIGSAASFKGVVNVLTKKAYTREGDKTKVGDVPADMKDAVDAARFELVEKIVEQDEALFERYLADEKLTDAELTAALAKAVRAGQVAPVVPTGATLVAGVDALLDAVVDLMPAPDSRGKLKLQDAQGKDLELPVSPDAPLAARVFKVVGESKLGEMTYFRVAAGKMRPGDTVYNSTQDETEKIPAIVSMVGKTRNDLTEATAGDIVATVKLKSTHIGDTLCTKDQPVLLPPIKYPKAVSYEAIEVEDKAVLEKVSAALNQLHDEDPTLRPENNELTRQLVVYGMGELHLAVAREKISERFGVKIEWTKPRIPFKETIKSAAQAQGKYKKQTGGRGQYGDVWLKLEPLPDADFEFVNGIVGGVVPGKFIPAVEKGLVEVMAEGVLAGYPVSNIKATLYDGSFHSVDSSEMAFKIAASMGFKKAFEDAKPILMEPIYQLRIMVPDEYLGDVMGDLNSRRGRVLGVGGSGRMKVIDAQVPLAEVYKYINTLRSMTQGVGHYEMEFDHYAEVPVSTAEAVIAEAEAAKKQE